jgi:hypothetical protein
MFTSGTVNAIARSGTNQTQRTQEIFSTCMLVDSVYGNTVYLKNCGYGVITNDSLGVYLDDTPLKFNMTPQKIGKGEVGTITVDTLGLNKGDYDLKISNPNLEVVQQVEAVLPDSCVLALDFGEGSGGTAYDSSGHGNNGVLSNLHATFYGDAHWVEGKFGYGLSLDGIGDYLLIDSLPLGENPNNGPVTITLWFKTSDINPSETKYLFSDNWMEIGFDLKNSGYLEAGVQQGIESLQPISDGWHFAALSYDYNNHIAYFYLDGQLQGSTSVPTSSEFNDEPFGIGVDYQGGNLAGQFNGIIDEVRIWNSYLTQAQIQAEMQSPIPVIEPVWSFKEPTDMWTVGKFGKALKFDGIGDYVNVIDSDSLRIKGDLTISTWIYWKGTDLDWNRIIEKGEDDDDNYGIEIQKSTSKLLFEFEDSVNQYHGIFEETGSVLTNTWQHVMVVYDDTNNKIHFYNNGIETHSETTTYSLKGTQTNNLWIGRQNYGDWNNNWFNGTIDSVRIYNKALNPEDTEMFLKMK